MLYEEKLPTNQRKEFTEKVKAISERLQINPDWLMFVMNFESAGTFSPSIKNPYTGATGLIQFMSSTASGLGTSILELSNMTAVEQLDFVEKYYKPYSGKIKSWLDAYLVTFFPLALGKPGSWIFQTGTTSAETITKYNSAFDVNKDGKITNDDIKQFFILKYPEISKLEIGIGLSGVVAFFLIAYLIFKT